jgi:tetratricopeptide (TPR) repeat protein
VLSKMGDYSKALSSHEKAIKIREKTLPPNHPDLSISYNNIGSVNDEMGNYSIALSFYKRAVDDIGQRSLPGNHPDLRLYKKNTKTVKAKM